MKEELNYLPLLKYIFIEYFIIRCNLLKLYCKDISFRVNNKPYKSWVVCLKNINMYNEFDNTWKNKQMLNDVRKGQPLNYS